MKKLPMMANPNQHNVTNAMGNPIVATTTNNGSGTYTNRPIAYAKQNTAKTQPGAPTIKRTRRMVRMVAGDAISRAA